MGDQMLECPECGHENPEHAHYCAGCRFHFVTRDVNARLGRTLVFFAIAFIAVALIIIGMTNN
jgi:hypothetical protein